MIGCSCLFHHYQEKKKLKCFKYRTTKPYNNKDQFCNYYFSSLVEKMAEKVFMYQDFSCLIAINHLSTHKRNLITLSYPNTLSITFYLNLFYHLSSRNLWLANS